MAVSKGKVGRGDKTTLIPDIYNACMKGSKSQHVSYPSVCHCHWRVGASLLDGSNTQIHVTGAPHDRNISTGHDVDLEVFKSVSHKVKLHCVLGFDQAYLVAGSDRG